MNCPSCKSNRVAYSRARGKTESAARLIIPIRFYRCHECNRRWAKLSLDWKSIKERGTSLTQALLTGVVSVLVIAAFLYLLF